jgi:hypothetical protein
MKNVIVNIVRVMLIVVMIIFTVIGIVALQEPEWNFVSTVVPMTCILVIQCCCYWFPWNQPQKQQQQPQQEWEVDKCDGCCRTKLVHTGYGLCEGCIYGCDPEPETAPESWKGKIVSVRFVKRGGQTRYMKDFIVLHVSHYKSGKVLIHGLEATDNGWKPKGFCTDQLINLHISDVATNSELREAYAVYRQLSNPNL